MTSSAKLRFRFLPRELQYHILSLAGPLTEFLNGALELTDRNKRNLRREGIRNGWRVDYRSLFDIEDTENMDSLDSKYAVTDIVSGESKEFHDWLMMHLGKSNKTAAVVELMDSIGWMDWWKDTIDSRQSADLRVNFERAFRFCHCQLIEYLMTKKGIWTEWCEDRYYSYLHSSIMTEGTDGLQLSLMKNTAWTILRKAPFSIDNNAMNVAAIIGDTEMVQWIHHNIPNCCSTDAIDYAALYGRLEVVKWLSENRIEGCTEMAMDSACANGHLEVAKWLLENRNEEIRDAVDLAASKGHLEILKCFYEAQPVRCSHSGLMKASEAGYLEIIKFVNESDTIRLSTELLREAVMNGHFELVKYLFAHRTENLYLEAALEAAIHCGEYDIAEWLEENM